MVVKSKLRRQILLAALSCAALVLISYEFIDRPLATFVHEFFQHPHIFVHISDMLSAIIALATIGAGGVALAYAAGWEPQPQTVAVIRVGLAAAVAVCVAVSVKNEFKWVFGRTWPDTLFWHNPSWIQDGVYEFRPFHGGLGWNSFPSGHTTLFMAPTIVLWMAFPRHRLFWSLPALATSVGLVVFDIHWLSDVIAGAFLGAACGYAVGALIGIKPITVEVAEEADEAEEPEPIEAVSREPAE